MVNESILLGIAQLQQPGLLRFPIAPTAPIHAPIVPRAWARPAATLLRLLDKAAPRFATSFPPHGVSNCLDEFGSLFDGAFRGPHAGGTPHGHATGAAFRHHWIGPDLAEGRFTLDWRIDDPGRRFPVVVEEPRRTRMEAQPSSHSLQAGFGLRLIRPPALTEWFAADYIHGDRFAALADIRIEDSGPVPRHVLDAGRVLYCMTDRAKELFAVIRDRQRPCILITHNADRNIDASLSALKPECVRHWFAQNVTVDRPDVTPIPLGLERPTVSGSRTRPEAFQTAARQTAEMRNLAYLNHSDWTNRRERIPIRWSLCWRDWVTVRRGPTPFEEYLQEMTRHRCVISPEGNGLDCHRTWEALYLGAIPLVRDSAAMRAFARLFPIAVFARLTTLTRRSVEQQLASIEDHGPGDWHERLRFPWWAGRILRTRHQFCGS